MTQLPSSSNNPGVERLAAPHFPSMEAELHALVAQIGSRSRKTEATLALENFDAKAKKASSYVNIGQNASGCTSGSYSHSEENFE